MAIADTITSMQTHTSNAYTMIGYGTDLTGTNKNLENLSTSIFNAFLEALRNPDTLFTNLPKKSGTGSNITLNDTANAPMRIELGATELTQAGTPTPSSPQNIHTISGSNTIKVEGKNRFTLDWWVSMFYSSYIKLDNGYTFTPNPSQPNLYSDGYTLSTPINLPVSISYKIKNGTGTNFRLRFWFDDGTALSVNSYGSGTGTDEQTITIDNYKKTGATKITKIGGDYSNVGTFTITEFMLNEGSTPLPYEPYTLQEADIDLGTNLVGLDTAQYKVDLKEGDKITARNETKTSLPLNFYTNYGDSTRNDFFYIGVNETRTITVTHDTKAIAWISNVPRTGNGIAWANYGSSILPYSTYKEPIEYCKIGNYEDKFIRTSGKNLLNIKSFSDGTKTKTSADVTATINNDGSITLSGTASGYGTFALAGVNPFTTTLFTLEAGTYTLSTTNSNQYLDFSLFDWTTQTELIGGYNKGTDTKTFATPQNVTYIRIQVTSNFSGKVTIYPMLEKGNIENPQYEPYGSNEWYIKKNIGKVVLDGTENWTEQWAGTERYGYRLNISDILISTDGNDNALMYSNYYVAYSQNTLWNVNPGICRRANQSQIIIRKDDTTTLADFKTWLSNNNTTVYYVLATPTYTKITGTLAEQLENVYKNMLSYTGTTNISQINEDLSFNLSVLAIEK